MSKKDNSSKKDIAVVGMSVWYPGAKDLLELWENVLAKRKQFRRMLDCRLPISEYQSDDRSVPDKTYGTKAAFMDGFEYDWATNRFPKSAFESTDLVHWLALDVAEKAIRDAGMDRKNIPTSKTGVLVGNSLTGEMSRADGMRLRWPYVKKVLTAAGQSRGLPPEELSEFIQVSEQFYKSVFATVTEDTLAGGLANTIAGRICNYFNLDGGGYTVDGACSSSLIAVANSASALVAQDLDMAIAGGVDVSLDAMELIGFSKVGALTDTEMKVYDRDGKGFIPGEGCGFVVLKRLGDAVRDGNKIYAVVKGWGISSDGNGGITAPKAAGQAIALKRAYEKAGYSVSDCSFIEGHGTGTAVGDKRELEGISIAMKDTSETVVPRSVGMTSLKSVIGHTKAAAGIGAFIKAVMGVNRRVLPPTSGCENRNPVFDQAAQGLYPLIEGEVRPGHEIMRAGVSSMGFGGINCHVTVESFGPPAADLQPSVPEKALMVSHSDTELFVFSGQSVSSLKEQIQKVLNEAPYISTSEMTDISAELAAKVVPSMPYRASVVAESPKELMSQLEKLQSMFNSMPAEGQVCCDETRTLWISNKSKPPKVGFLFPGQGSQRLNMARTLVQRHEWAQQLVHQADAWLHSQLSSKISDLIYKPIHKALHKEELETWNAKLTDTSIAQPSICLASYLWAQRLAEVGVECQVVAGHSLGELTALCWAGAYDHHALMELSALRGQLMSAKADDAGSMVSLVCNREVADQIVAELGSEIVVANINGPQQVVLSGTKPKIEQAIQLASSRGIQTIKLNVSNAFHSPLVEEASKKFRSQMASISADKQFKFPFISGVDGGMKVSSEGLNEYLSNQIIQPVDFVRTIETISQKCDFLIEVGPGGVLSGLTRNIQGPKGLNCFPVEPKSDKQSDFLKTIGAYFVSGGSVRFEKMFSNRLIRKYVPFSEKKFNINPCEKPFPQSLVKAPQVRTGLVQAPSILAAAAVPASTSVPVAEAKATTVAAVSSKDLTSQEVTQILIEILSSVTGFSADVFKMEMRLLDDLNLDSIKAGEAISSLAKRCSLKGEIDPIQMANATLGEIVEIIMKMNPTGSLGAGSVSSESSLTQVVPLNTPDLKPTVGQPSLNESVQGAEDAESFLYETISKITGFEKSVFKPEMRLLEDLNLDSIKAGEVIVALKNKYPNGKEIDPIQFANATLKDIVDFFQSGPVSVETVKKSPGNGMSLIEKTVLEVTSRSTGYPQSSLGLEMSYETDLRVEERKFSEIVRECCQKIDIPPNLDMAPLKGCTIGKLISVLNSIHQTAKASTVAEKPKSEIKSDKEPWVRNFKTEMVFKSRTSSMEPQSQRFIDQWPNTKALLIGEPEDQALVSAFAEELTLAGSSVVCSSFVNLDRTNSKFISEFTHVLLFVPSQKKPLSTDLRDRIKGAIERVHFLVTLPKPESSPRRSTTIACIEQSDGYFNHREFRLGFDQSVFTSTLQSLNIERPECRIRCFDIALGLDAKWVVCEVLQDLQTRESYQVIGYDILKNRFERQIQLSMPKTYKRRAVQWSSEDVVVFTGGAKGITAECALAFAQETGVKVALVGSSQANPISAEDEIGKNLQRFQQAGVQFKYYSCDVTDERKVKSLIDSISEELGPVTGIVHGAGKNVPRRLSQVLSSAEVFQEISPKLIGAMNLGKVVDSNKLKMFCGFTSILGVIGVHGNGWYGFSNEALNSFLMEYKQSHPKVEVLTCAFGMWDEVGMASKLGSGKKFSAAGVNLIPVHQGVQRFLELVRRDPGTQQILVTARLWKDSQLACENPAPVTSRFLEKITANTRSVEVISRVHLSLETDLYLKDHKYNGSYLFPTVFGLEAMAQVAAYAMGVDHIHHLVIENLQLNTAIVVNPEKGIEIEVYAEVEEPESDSSERKVKVGVRSENSNFSKDCFAGIFRFPKAMANRKMQIQSGAPLEINMAKEVYGPILFHGKTYQRLSSIYSLNSKEMNFGVQAKSAFENQKASFADPNKGFILGDPYFRDALLQASQPMVTRQKFLPISCGRWEIHSTQAWSEVRVGRAVLKDLTDKYINVEVACADESGNLIESLTDSRGVLLKAVPDNPSADDLGSRKPYFERIEISAVVQKYCSRKGWRSPGIVIENWPGFASMSFDGRHRAEVEILKKTISSHAPGKLNIDHLQLNWNESGKPFISGIEIGFDVSFSHVGDYCVCAFGKGQIGCDLEEIIRRSPEDWSSLLGPDFSGVFKALCLNLDQKDLIGTLVWSAREAAGKAFQSKNFTFENYSFDGESAEFEARCGNELLKVFAFKIPSKTEKEYVFSLAADFEKIEAKVPNYDNCFSINVDPMGPKGFNVRWPVTFKEAGNLKRGVYFSKFFEWAGRARELAILPVLGDAAEIFTSGEFGWVTNSSSTEYFRSMEVGDILEARIWSGEPHGSANSTVDIFYDWYRVDASGNEDLVARTKMATTWVRVRGHGLVEVAPFPETFQAFFASIPESNLVPIETATVVEAGESIYIAPSGVATGPVLAEHVFETTLEDSNLVGNVYFSNYTVWQGRVRDAFFQKLAPELFRDSTQGEPFCVRSQVKHLREAMPFDQIQVAMRLQALNEAKISLYFEYFQFVDGKRGGKIAFAEHELVWADQTRHQISPRKLPRAVMYYLKKCIRDFGSAKDVKKVREAG